MSKNGIDFGKVNNRSSVDDAFWAGKDDENPQSSEKDRNRQKRDLEYKINRDDVFKGTVIPKFVDIKIPLDKIIPAPESFNPYPPADEETLDKMKESIFKYGQLKVSVVREQPDGTFMIIGGHNRLNAIKALHEEHPEETRFCFMRCNVYTMDDINDEAFKIAVVDDNEAQRAQEDKRLLAIGYKVRKENFNKSSLRKYGEGRTREKMMEKYNISGGAASRMEKISHLVSAFLPAYISKKMSDSDALAISSLPEDLQMYLFNNNIFSLEPAKRKVIAACKTIEELKALLLSTPEAEYNGIKVSSKMPSTSKNYSLPIPKEYAKDVFEALIKSVKALEIEDKNGKDFLIEVLKGYASQK